MTKNITVIDETGAAAGMTYPKRAKGMVKNGRAYWTDEKTVRLLPICPDKKERSNMADSLNNVIDNQLSKLQEKMNLMDPEGAEAIGFEIISTLNDLKSIELQKEVVALAREQLAFAKENFDYIKEHTDGALAPEIQEKMLDIIANIVSGYYEDEENDEYYDDDEDMESTESVFE